MAALANCAMKIRPKNHERVFIPVELRVSKRCRESPPAAPWRRGTSAVHNYAFFFVPAALPGRALLLHRNLIVVVIVSSPSDSSRGIVSSAFAPLRTIPSYPQPYPFYGSIPFVFGDADSELCHPAHLAQNQPRGPRYRGSPRG